MRLRDIDHRCWLRSRSSRPLLYNVMSKCYVTLLPFTVSLISWSRNDNILYRCLLNLCGLQYCTISINSTSHAPQSPILVEIRPLVTSHGGRGRMGPPSAYPIWAWRAAARPKLVETSDHVTVTGPCGRTCPPKRTCHGSPPVELIEMVQ